MCSREWDRSFGALLEDPRSESWIGFCQRKKSSKMNRKKWREIRLERELERKLDNIIRIVTLHKEYKTCTMRKKQI